MLLYYLMICRPSVHFYVSIKHSKETTPEQNNMNQSIDFIKQMEFGKLLRIFTTTRTDCALWVDQSNSAIIYEFKSNTFNHLDCSN